jgi:hypothetical protein
MQAAHLLSYKPLTLLQMHAKWSPVATAVFRYEADVRLNSRSPLILAFNTPNPLIILFFSKLDRLSADTRREWTQSCPTRVFSFNEVTQVPKLQPILQPNYNRFCN